MNKKVFAIVAIGAVILSLPGCARKTMGEDIEPTEEVEFVPSEQPEFYKTIQETKEQVKDDSTIYNVHFVNDYDTIWSKLTYLVVPTSIDGINGKIPKEEDDYCLEFTYDEIKDVPMASIQAATILSSTEYTHLNALTYIGEGETEGTFAEILLKKRSVMADVSTDDAFKYMTGFEKGDKAIYERVIELYGNPTFVETGYEESMNIWSISLIYRLNGQNVVFILAGPKAESAVILIEPIEEVEESDVTTDPTEDNVSSNNATETTQGA